MKISKVPLLEEATLLVLLQAERKTVEKKYTPHGPVLTVMLVSQSASKGD